MLTQELDRLTRGLHEVLSSRKHYEERITLNIAAEDEIRRDLADCQKALEATRK